MPSICEGFSGITLTVDAQTRTKTHNYRIRGAATADIAYDFLISHLTGLGIYPFNTLLKIKSVSVKQLQDQQGQIWDAEATWDAIPRLDVGDIRIRIAGSGSTARLTHDLGTVEVQGDLTIAELAGAINVNQDGEAEGVDVYIPTDSMTIERGLAPGTLTLAYIANLRAARGRVNDATWQGFAAGEVLFTDYEASSGNAEVDRISYTFELEPNINGFQTAGYTFVNKKGHDYVSIGTAVKYDKTKNVKYPVARWAAIHQVYLRANFTSVLGF